MRYTLAFDIDGTSSVPHGHTQSQEADKDLQLSHGLNQETWVPGGWVPGLLEACVDSHNDFADLIFVTGRTTSWSLHFLQHLKIPFRLAALNGAELFSFPEGRCINKAYLESSLVEDLLHSTPGPAIIYTDSKILFRPASRDSILLSHLERRKSIQKEDWISYESTHLKRILALRLFMFEEEARKLQAELERSPLSCAIMKDSFNSEVYIAQITAQGVNKGYAVEMLTRHRPLLAFGDDHNDIPMFQKADRAFAIEGSPPELVQFAEQVISRKSLVQFVKQLTREAKE